MVVYDLLGRRVVRLVDEAKPAGVHDVAFDVRSLASGLYVVVLTAESGGEQQRSIIRLTAVR
jgi:hypothetical protein